MRSLDVGRATLTRFTREPLLIAALVAVIVVPLLYAALYLWAFWDPYGRLDHLPVALVNLDEPAKVTLDGDVTVITAGADLEKQLIEGHDVDWQVMTREQAATAVQTGKAYLSVTIPHDFSARVASASGRHPRAATLDAVYGESSNMLASQIGKRVVVEVRDAVRESVAEQYLDKVYVAFGTIHDGMADAADGASKLSDGLLDARSGSARLAYGARQAADGGSQLSAGLVRISDGAVTLSAGAGTLAGGAAALDSGLTTARTGAAALAVGSAATDAGAHQLAAKLGDARDGARMLAGGAGEAAAAGDQLASGLDRISGSSDKLTTGAGELTDGLDTLAVKTGDLQDAASQVAGGAGKVADGVASARDGLGRVASGAGDVSHAVAGARDSLESFVAAHPGTADDPDLRHALGTLRAAGTGAEQVADGLRDAGGDMETLATGASATAAGADELAAGLGAYAGGVKRAASTASSLADGITSYTGGVDTAAQGSGRLASGLDALAPGATTLADGMTAARAGAATLADGTGRVASGASALKTGIVRAADGAASLHAGSARLASGASVASAALRTAVSGSRELAAGTTAVATGADQLASGIRNAHTGSVALASGLTAGAADVPTDSRALRVRRAATNAAPVSLTENRLDPVPTYGTGFAPYFIPLALWVGAIVIFLIMRPVSDRALASSAPSVVVALAGWWPAALLGAVQAVVLVAVLQLGLGLEPVDPLATYAVAILFALAATAILQMLGVAFGPAGKLGAIVLLMLQLTSAGGSFPIQLVPVPLQAVSPFLPMTYAVAALRTTLTGGGQPLAGRVLTLAAFAAAALAVTVAVVSRRRVWTMARLHPVLEV